MQSILDHIKAGWELYKKHWTFVLIVLAVCVGINIFTGIVQGFFPEKSFLYSLVAFLSSLLSFFIELGIIAGALHLFRTGEEWPIKKLFSQKEIFWKAFLGMILYVIAVAVGLILLIIPGIYIAVRYSFLSYVFVDQRLSIADSFREAARLSDGYRWKLLGFLFVLVLLNLGGFLLFVVGLIITIPVTLLATVSVYESLRKLKSEAVEKVSVEVSPTEETLVV